MALNAVLKVNECHGVEVIENAELCLSGLNRLSDYKAVSMKNLVNFFKAF